ncbi:hypothetical protein BGZ93_002100 [Podila epicladia]|nr:hypothetical protein BGZ93_002100 [Podila epicladia]
MKFNTSIVLATAAALLSVSAFPMAPEADSASAAEIQHLTGRAKCCKYAVSGQWCGPSGCCVWQMCTKYGSGCGGCCQAYNCY